MSLPCCLVQVAVCDSPFLLPLAPQLQSLKVCQGRKRRQKQRSPGRAAELQQKSVRRDETGFFSSNHRL